MISKYLLPESNFHLFILVTIFRYSGSDAKNFPVPFLRTGFSFRDLKTSQLQLGLDSTCISHCASSGRGKGKINSCELTMSMLLYLLQPFHFQHKCHTLIKWYNFFAFWIKCLYKNCLRNFRWKMVTMTAI